MVTVAVDNFLSYGVKGTQRRAIFSMDVQYDQGRRARGPPAEIQLLQIAQDFEHLRVLGRFTDVVHIDVANDALLVDDDDGALADAFVLFPDSVLLRDV